MALCNFHNTLLSSSSYSSSFSPLSPFLKPPNALRFFTKFSTSPFSLRALNSSNNDNPTGESAGGEAGPRRISEQSSWEAKDSEGRDYLYRLGKEADNMNIAVGARAGIIDDLFVGNFLGRDCNFLFRIGYFVGWKLGLWLSSKKWKYLSIGWVVHNYWEFEAPWNVSLRVEFSSVFPESKRSSLGCLKNGILFCLGDDIVKSVDQLVGYFLGNFWGRAWFLPPLELGFVFLGNVALPGLITEMTMEFGVHFRVGNCSQWRW